MKRSIILVLLVLFIAGFLGVIVEAASFPYPLNQPIMSCNTKREAFGKFSDPCSSLCDLLATTKNALYFGLTLVLLVIAPIAFVIGGIIMIISVGNEEKFKKGKAILTNAVWGVVIVLAAFVIVNTFLTILAPKISGNVISSSWNSIDCKPESLPGTVHWE
jgi:hypothetical protein